MMIALNFLFLLLLSSIDATPVVKPLKVLTATLALASTTTGVSPVPNRPNRGGVIPNMVSKLFQNFVDSIDDNELEKLNFDEFVADLLKEERPMATDEMKERIGIKFLNG
jgi:hypothetical protein